MRVILAEKPSVALDIAKALGSPARHEGYVMVDDTAITWAFGHLVSLAAPEVYDIAWKKWSWDTLPMLPEAFRLESITKTKAQLNVIKKLFREADRVVAATDADREGHLCDYCQRRWVVQTRRPPVAVGEYPGGDSQSVGQYETERRLR